MAREFRPRTIAALAVAAVVLAVAGFCAGVAWPRGGHPAAGSVTLSAADIGFAQRMSVHHDQAVLLAQTLPRDADPPVRAIADQILIAQTAEIATMHGWLLLFDQPFSAAAGPDMAGGSAMPGMGSGPAMPGMASTAELTRLSQLHGHDAEILFLQLMIRHHRGGVDMAQAAYNQPLLQPVRRVALDMVQNQGTEIATMTALLSTLGAAPLPYP